MEKLDRRIGVVAVKMELITPEQLFEAMKIQIFEDLEGTKHRFIGEILCEKGYITTIQINEMLKSMGI